MFVCHVIYVSHARKQDKVLGFVWRCKAKQEQAQHVRTQPNQILQFLGAPHLIRVGYV